MKDIDTKTITGISFFCIEEEHYGLNVLFQFNGSNLLFNSHQFLFKENDEVNELFKWKNIKYEALASNLSIVDIREDEATSYFIEFSNGDIFFIYQIIDGMEFWSQDFEIVSSTNLKRYREIKEYMDEDFVEDIVL